MTPLQHRPDIEGLRGVAVLAVLAVHAWPETLRGGFVGVDIFFVLSGFLITSLIFDALQQSQFSIGSFYARRALRLFPALCIVLLGCLLCALLTFPGEARQIGKHVAASAVFASNIALWGEAGYFDASSESKPLLHLWSLGIEEQFYLLWPWAAVAVFRWPRHAFRIVLVLLLGSFWLNVAWVDVKAKGTFFLLPTRAWELLMGAALASLMCFGSGVPAAAAAGRALKASRIGPHLPTAMACSGVACIAAAFMLLDKGAAFPGWWALLPTTGTVMLLAAGHASWVNRRVLAHPILVFYGSISYPLYLWHWPLLVFPMLWGFEMDNALRVLVLTASVALATLTKEYVEAPIRFGRHGRRAPWALGAMLACIGCAGWALYLSDGLVEAYPREVREVARADIDFDYGGYRQHRCFLDLEGRPQTFAAECWAAAAAGKSSILLWGDSHAASLYPGLAAAPHGTSLAQFTKARCPPVQDLPPVASRHCREANEHVWRAIATRPPDTVVLGGYWSLYATDELVAQALLSSLRQTVERLSMLGVRHVVVVGHLPTWTLPLPRMLLREWARTGDVPERSLVSLDRRGRELDRAVRNAVSGTRSVFLSPYEKLCNAGGCLVTLTSQGVVHPLVHDESHLTVRGSTALLQRSREVFLD